MAMTMREHESEQRLRRTCDSIVQTIEDKYTDFEGGYDWALGGRWARGTFSPAGICTVDYFHPSTYYDAEGWDLIHAMGAFEIVSPKGIVFDSDIPVPKKAEARFQKSIENKCFIRDIHTHRTTAHFHLRDCHWTDIFDALDDLLRD